MDEGWLKLGLPESVVKLSKSEALSIVNECQALPSLNANGGAYVESIKALYAHHFAVTDRIYILGHAF